VTAAQTPHQPALYDVVYAILASTPRHDRAGRPVSTSAWNRTVAAQIAAAVEGPPSPLAARGEPPADPRLTAGQRCLARCADALGVEVAELLSSRLRPVVEARQITAYVLLRQLGLSLSEVGLMLGKDHTTIHHAKRTVMRQMGRDDWWRLRVRDCMDRARGVAA
jgi:hypothetical protein